ncbi:MarR family transcriptional regulator [uncultured Cohaesibacter sp.]|uniref:MarR family winged helix-turn-helix transcriptional regulator n=1 Tax=uncultured Cohaesibacter sp. TaxID=1002546 RepID=UPI00293119E5|nr:MarR family transcriptional regulator [uncultured Cohaesibacter sp.]
MSETNDDLHLGYLIYEVSRLMRRLYEQEAKSLNLTMQQARVISFLNNHPGGISQTQIANAFDRDPMTMSGILDRLQKRELVKRVVDPSDSRAKLVLLTEEGECLYKKAKAVGSEIREKLTDRVFGRLSNSQKDALVEGLEAIRDELGELSYGHKEDEK